MKIMAASSKGDPKKKSYKQTKGYSRMGGILKSASSKASLESKAKRSVAFDNATDKKKVAELNKINTQTGKAVDEGLQLNDYGAPKGGQKHKKFNLVRKQKAKY